MFQTQRKNNDFDIHILNKLSEDLRNAIQIRHWHIIHE